MKELDLYDINDKLLYVEQSIKAFGRLVDILKEYYDVDMETDIYYILLLLHGNVVNISDDLRSALRLLEKYALEEKGEFGSIDT